MNPSSDLAMIQFLLALVAIEFVIVGIIGEYERIKQLALFGYFCAIPPLMAFLLIGGYLK